MVPGAKERPVQEFLNALLFRPLAHLVVLLLLRTPVRPHHLVLFHTGLVLGAAWLLLRGEDLGAALLLQLHLKQGTARRHNGHITGTTGTTHRHKGHSGHTTGGGGRNVRDTTCEGAP